MNRAPKIFLPRPDDLLEKIMPYKNGFPVFFKLLSQKLHHKSGDADPLLEFKAGSVVQVPAANGPERNLYEIFEGIPKKDLVIGGLDKFDADKIDSLAGIGLSGILLCEPSDAFESQFFVECCDEKGILPLVGFKTREDFLKLQKTQTKILCWIQDKNSRTPPFSNKDIHHSRIIIAWKPEIKLSELGALTQLGVRAYIYGHYYKE